MQLTEHFSVEEMTHSETAARRGIPNDIPPELRPNLLRVAQFLEKVRIRLSYNAILVHSGYRSAAVNEAVGGVQTGGRISAHTKALAADIVCPGYGGPYGVAIAIRDTPELMSDVHQLILEYGWVHVGLAAEGVEPRHELLTKRSASAPYEHGILA